MKDNLESFNHICDFSPKNKNQTRSKDADIITDKLLKDGLLKARSKDNELLSHSSKKDLELMSKNQQCDSSNDGILTD